ncbi:MAG: 4-(cytidine 5'-diphospho)-2-C-methyl-D-erythritol kinase [Dehalococcoidia bacterium]|nr:4-(cytidine 5'-diphospho)-2-C-methyl-D-erythritol kinase [Dehalococcoidia bacterium]
MSITLRAYAKVNLTLEVLAKRGDGYHEIATVLQTISLADTLSFELSDVLELRCSVPSLQLADNLVLKAAKLLGKATGCSRGALIQLTKEIPIAAGLGSGATDAAATLAGLNRLWETNLPPQGLLELAADLGSDVSPLLYGGIVLAKGRGEQVACLPPMPELWMVLLRPPINPIPNKTAQLYSKLTPSHFTSGQFAERLVDHLHEGSSISADLLHNVFEQVAFDFFRDLSEYRSVFVEAGAETIHLAGAGPCLFTLVSDEARGKAVLNNLEAAGQEAYLVRTVDAEPLASVRDRQC